MAFQEAQYPEKLFDGFTTQNRWRNSLDDTVNPDAHDYDQIASEIRATQKKLNEVAASGAIGATGPAGPAGPTGPAGDDGATGADGGAVCIFNAQVGTTYTLELSDTGKLVTLTNASPIAVTIPTNADVPFVVGARIDCIQGGAGKVTFSGAGVTINSKSSAKSIAGTNVAVTLIKEATDTWYLIGDLLA